MTDRASDPCEGVRQRIAERLDKLADTWEPLTDEAAAAWVDALMDAEVRPLVEALDDADSDMSWMLHRGRNQWNEHELHLTIAKIRRALTAARTPRRTSDGE